MWTAAEPTGCSQKCGLKAGESGEAGNIICSTPSVGCDDSKKPNATLCPSTPACGQAIILFASIGGSVGLVLLLIALPVAILMAIRRRRSLHQASEKDTNLELPHVDKQKTGSSPQTEMENATDDSFPNILPYNHYMISMSCVQDISDDDSTLLAAATTDAPDVVALCFVEYSCCYSRELPSNIQLFAVPYPMSVRTLKSNNFVRLYKHISRPKNLLEFFASVRKVIDIWSRRQNVEK